MCRVIGLGDVPVPVFPECLLNLSQVNSIKKKNKIKVRIKSNGQQLEPVLGDLLTELFQSL